MTDPREGYLEQIRRSGVSLSPELAAAFAAVPREVFVPDGFHRRDGGWATPADPDFRAIVYSDDVLVTKMDGRIPISSSSQPSLMAIMIEALRVAPGARILEIGAGTGYNAALLAALGAEVTSVDVQEDVAVRARAALIRAGTSGVRVEQADGYAGMPGRRFDRIIVTVGVGGLSPHWLEQLHPGGLVVAPVTHAGTHPVLTVHGGPDGPVSGRVVCGAGFMSAAGPLNVTAFPPPAGAGVLTGLVEHAPARFDPELEPPAYRDLWYAAGAWDRRASHATIAGDDDVFSHEHTHLALLDGPGSGAVILADGRVLATGDAIARAAVTVVDRWTAAGRPPMQAWRIGLVKAGPVWAPATWEL